jgi:hypothetical protein
MQRRRCTGAGARTRHSTGLRETLAAVLIVVLAVGPFALASRAEPQIGPLTVPRASANAMSLGDSIRFEAPPAPPLVEEMPLSEGVQSARYLTRVGGVAFGSVAVGHKGVRVQSLVYDPTRTDGERLVVTMALDDGRTRTVVARIPDWQLVPIARFAASRQHACFTIFGELQDSADARTREAQGQRILNYHEAFTDTLLGLRVFQADILILHGESADLPKVGGAYLLGSGESAPDVPANTSALYAIHDFLQNQPGGPFQSYVISDHGQRVTFGAQGDDLVLTGHPHWYCWKRKMSDDAAFAAADQQAQQQAASQLEREYAADAASMSSDELAARYTYAYQEVRINELYDGLLSPAYIEAMPAYSLALSAEIQRLGGINPAVYDSLIALMRYSAFFRQVQATNPAAFTSLLEALEGVQPQPLLETPTVMFPPSK